MIPYTGMTSVKRYFEMSKRFWAVMQAPDWEQVLYVNLLVGEDAIGAILFTYVPTQVFIQIMHI